MLLAHLSSVEDQLLAQARAPGNAAAAPTSAALTTALVRGFLEPMFGGALRVVAGALVGPASRPADPHPVFEALLCPWEAPRLALAQGQAAWLADQTVATVAVVPVLTEAAVLQAVQAAVAAKALAGSATGPGLRCHLLGFDGPKDMLLAHQWLKLAYRQQGIVEPDMPVSGSERCAVASPGLDGVFVLGRGFLNFDNVEVGFLNDEARLLTFGMCWAVATAERGALMSLWLQLQQAATAAAGRRIDPRAYIAGFDVGTLRCAN